MFSVVRSTSVMIVVTVARTIVTMMDRRILAIAAMSTGLLDGYELCQDFHDPGYCGECCVSQGDVGVMLYESGAGGSGIDENIIAFRSSQFGSADQLCRSNIRAEWPRCPW